MMKIAVAGLGYVGLSLACLLAKRNDVSAFDIDQKRVNLIRNRKSPIIDDDLPALLEDESLLLNPTTEEEHAFHEAEIVFIATPTNYDPETNEFDTSSIEQVIESTVKICPKALIVIKSTIPVGYTQTLRKLFHTERIIFSPEFLREGCAVRDNRFPSRIVVGDTGPNGSLVAERLKEISERCDVPVCLTDSTEAEAIKLFSNTYLAMRVAFFNEVDTYALSNNLNTRQVIDAVSLDPRIGSHYNNPSFGYGGYCLPKDTKQLLASYSDIPQDMIAATVQANKTRKKFIVSQIIARSPKMVGIYRVTMKSGSDNFRSSSANDIISRLKRYGVEVIIFEPFMTNRIYMGCAVINDLGEFKKKADIIVANRNHASLADIPEKIFTRDLFGEN
jgi:UDPglucose 6-dehydrogenase